MIEIDPKEVSTAKFHGFLVGSVGPRPIALASTIDKNGVSNLSPFSFYNVFGANPPLLIFAPNRRVRDNTTKDTYHNLKEIPEVVIHAVPHRLVQQVSLSSVEYPAQVDEFKKSGLTPVPSKKVKPFRVKESPVHFECAVKQIIETGKEGGAANLILAEILYMHIDESVLDADGFIDQTKMDLVGRLGGTYYTRAHGEALFQVPKPVSSLGIGVDQIPDPIRYSRVLSGNDLGMLGNVEHLPSQAEVKEFRSYPALETILSEGGNDAETSNRLHLLAKKLLEEGKVQDAWKVLLQEFKFSRI